MIRPWVRPSDPEELATVRRVAANHLRALADLIENGTIDTFQVDCVPLRDEEQGYRFTRWEASAELKGERLFVSRPRRGDAR